MSDNPNSNAEMEKLRDIEATEKQILRSSTLMPIGVAAAIGLALFQGYREISAQFLSLRDQLNEVRVDLRDLRNSLAMVQGTRWTSQDMEIYALRMKLNNPSIVVPDVSEIISRRAQAQPLKQ